MPVLGERKTVDVRELVSNYSVEELNEAADEYYRKKVANADYFFKKPLGQVSECAEYLISFAEVLNLLRPLPGMTLLDFGAGTCWSTRYFADFQLHVIASDVSATALEIGKHLFARNPVAGVSFEPQFLVFDGHRLQLADASVDRIACFDAFHHVPNPRAVLLELGRVLKDGGIAAFSEPGPTHSASAQSQYEMKNFKVIENDIVLEEIWDWAREAGFTGIRVAVFNAAPLALDLSAFNRFMTGDGRQADAYSKHVRLQLQERRLFCLHKGSSTIADSRDRQGLMCELAVDLPSTRVHAGEIVTGRARAANTGSAIWLPSDAPFGPVRLGVHLKTETEDIRDFVRIDLPSGPVPRGASVEIQISFRAPEHAGEYSLEFDLVSEGVCWFEWNGARIVQKRLVVI